MVDSDSSDSNSDQSISQLGQSSMSSLSPATNLDDETKISVVEFYNKITEGDKLRALLAISVGQPTDLVQNERLQAHIKGGRIESKVSLCGKIEYNNEILHRGACLDAAKQPRPTSWKNPKKLS